MYESIVGEHRTVVLEGHAMPLNLYPDVYASGSVPAGWTPRPGGTIKYPVRNASVHRHLREGLTGRWQKVIKLGNLGDIHYFEHASGRVAGVKFFPSEAV